MSVFSAGLNSATTCAVIDVMQGALGITIKESRIVYVKMRDNVKEERGEDEKKRKDER